MRYAIYWLNGEVSMAEGDDIADACRKRGIGAGAVNAMDFYHEYTDEKGLTHVWDPEKKNWVRKKPIIDPEALAEFNKERGVIP